MNGAVRAARKRPYPTVAPRAPRRSDGIWVPVPSYDICSTCLGKELREHCAACRERNSLATELYLSTIAHVDSCAACEAAFRRKRWPLAPTCMRAILRDARKNLTARVKLADERPDDLPERAVACRGRGAAQCLP